MKAVILGAPGSGKTKIARRIVRRLNALGPYTSPPSVIPGNQWKMIDEYVNRLQKRTGREFGAASDLGDNLMVWSERRLLEDEAMQKGHHVITCGSIYETTIYSAARSMLIPSLADEQAIMEETLIAQVTMQALGVLETQTFDYDALFYLPLSGEHHDWSGIVDAKLGDVLEGFSRHAVILDGTDKQKVDRATEIIRTLLAALADLEQQTT